MKAYEPVSSAAADRGESHAKQECCACWACWAFFVGVWTYAEKIMARNARNGRCTRKCAKLYAMVP